jgi:hypothetical protein
MTKQQNSTTTQKKSPSSEYKALLRAAEAAKKQAELLGLPYITKNTQLDKACL